jgi:putative transposase
LVVTRVGDCRPSLYSQANGKPDVFDTDQGSQFTGSAFTSVLATNGIRICMDGKGAWRDVYLWVKRPIGRYLDFYNGRRPHSSLDGTTPDQAYFTPLPLRLAA